MDEKKLDNANVSGNAEEVNSVIMNISNGIFTSDNTDSRNTSLLTKMNNLTDLVGNAVNRFGGRLISITSSGISAMFGDDLDSAVQCAVTICKETESEESLTMFGEIHIGIDYGTVFLGVVGYNGFSMPLVVSEKMDTAVFLSEKAKAYNSKILVTKSAVSLNGEFLSNYNVRRLGLLYHKASGLAEDFFDIFDGDLSDSKYSKMRSRLFFDTGVDLFRKGEFLEARSYFIEILKFDRNDAAAKQYVFCCDRCLSGEAGDDEKTYLEIC